MTEEKIELEINECLAPNEASTDELRFLLSLLSPFKTPSCTQLMPKVPEPSNLFQGQNLA